MLRNLIIVVTLIIVALLPFVTKEHDADVPSSVWIVKDLPYLQGSENKAHKLDVYVSRNKNKKHPVVIWIHGGGWSTGSKADTPALELVSRGYAAVSIDYRLSDDSIFPAQIEDSKEAVRWVREHGTEYGFDTAKIAVWGISAGGHLAALLGTSQSVDAFENKGEPKNSANVDVVLDWCGPADLTTFTEQAKEERFRQYQPERFVQAFLGGSPEDKSELAKEASPVTY
ncbi:MAG: alpha/beta hydrolase, partial [Cyanobacteria bacterium]|nr:alpha/beta hydrolase [Cyanobacteriota bacterium]